MVWMVADVIPNTINFTLTPILRTISSSVSNRYLFLQRQTELFGKINTLIRLSHNDQYFFALLKNAKKYLVIYGKFN